MPKFHKIWVETPSKEDAKEVLEHLDTDHSGHIDFEATN